MRLKDHKQTVDQKQQPKSVGCQATVGTVSAISDDGEVFVDYPIGSRHPAVPARSIIPPRHLTPGSEVLLVFEDGNPFRPVIVGTLHEQAALSSSRSLPKEGDVAERIVLEAQEEVTIRCGDASITLNRDGRVTIRGASLLSRSSGSNRIKGASVQIN